MSISEMSTVKKAIKYLKSEIVISIIHFDNLQQVHRLFTSNECQMNIEI